MTEIILNKGNFEEEVLRSSAPVLVDFWASWCGPCQVMKPIIAELAEEVDASEMKVASINIDEEQEIAQKFNVMSIPTFLFFKNSQVADSLMGMQIKEELRSHLEKLV